MHLRRDGTTPVNDYRRVNAGRCQVQAAVAATLGILGGAAVDFGKGGRNDSSFRAEPVALRREACENCKG